MHVIDRRTLRQFADKHTDAKKAVDIWYHAARKARWRNSADIKEIYPSASIIDRERVVFNICQNNYRLVVRINYISGTIFVRFIGTHQEYDKIKVETI